MSCNSHSMWATGGFWMDLRAVAWRGGGWQVARLRRDLREMLRESERDAELMDRLQAERAAMEDDARASSSAKVANVQVQNLQLNSLLVENAELLTQVRRAGCLPQPNSRW
jgi:hypothetical protein